VVSIADRLAGFLDRRLELDAVFTKQLLQVTDLGDSHPQVADRNQVTGEESKNDTLVSGRKDVVTTTPVALALIDNIQFHRVALVALEAAQIPVRMAKLSTVGTADHEAFH